MYVRGLLRQGTPNRAVRFENARRGSELNGPFSVISCLDLQLVAIILMYVAIPATPLDLARVAERDRRGRQARSTLRFRGLAGHQSGNRNSRRRRYEILDVS